MLDVQSDTLTVSAQMVSMSSQEENTGRINKSGHGPAWRTPYQLRPTISTMLVPLIILSAFATVPLVAADGEVQFASVGPSPANLDVIAQFDGAVGTKFSDLSMSHIDFPNKKDNGYWVAHTQYHTVKFSEEPLNNNIWIILRDAVTGANIFADRSRTVKEVQTGNAGGLSSDDEMNRAWPSGGAHFDPELFK